MCDCEWGSGGVAEVGILQDGLQDGPQDGSQDGSQDGLQMKKLKLKQSDWDSTLNHSSPTLPIVKFPAR